MEMKRRPYGLSLAETVKHHLTNNTKKHPAPYSNLTEPCLLFTGTRNNQGYAQFKYEGKELLLSRSVYAIHHEISVYDLQCVLHRCDNGPLGCVEISHLYEGSQKDNADDMIRRGRADPKGESNPNATLTDDQVLDVCFYCGEGVSQVRIAEHFGVSVASISRIVRGKTWTHITGL